METEPKRASGRPRPLETVERDQRMYEYLSKGPASVRQAAEHFRLREITTYHSLRRLRAEGLVVRILVDDGRRSRSMWRAVGG